MAEDTPQASGFFDMHILMALVGILGGLAFWWWRFKAVKEAADDVTDVAGRAWGKYKRYKFRKKAEASPVEAVEDPVAAAVVMMIAMVQEEREFTLQHETRVAEEVRRVMGVEDTSELMVFAKWVAKHVEDANNVSLRYAKLWHRALNRAESRDLVDMVRRIAEADGPLSDKQKRKIEKLEQRLGLQ